MDSGSIRGGRGREGKSERGVEVSLQTVNKRRSRGVKLLHCVKEMNRWKEKEDREKTGEDTAFDGIKQYRRGQDEEEEEEEGGAVRLSLFWKDP